MEPKCESPEGDDDSDFEPQNVAHQTNFLTRVKDALNWEPGMGSMYRLSCEGRPIDNCGGFDEFRMVMEDTPATRSFPTYPCVGPVLYPAFCDALSQELSESGLHVSWHAADIRLKLDTLQEEVEAKDFMRVSWV